MQVYFSEYILSHCCFFNIFVKRPINFQLIAPVEFAYERASFFFFLNALALLLKERGGK